MLIVLPFHPEDSVVFDANLVPSGLQCLRVGIPGLCIVVVPLALPFVGHVRIAHMHQLQGLALTVPDNLNIQQAQDGVGMACNDALIVATASACDAVTVLVPGLQLAPELSIGQGRQVVAQG
eukprot:Skav209166  [mRNA]  locus=scaffold1137:347469:350814:+ [translate_table: standard]